MNAQTCFLKLQKIFNRILNESSPQHPIYMREWLVAFNAPTALFLRKIPSAVESSEEGLSTALKEISNLMFRAVERRDCSFRPLYYRADNHNIL